MSEQQTRVGIVMPVHNRRELTLRCLRSLADVDQTGIHVASFVVDDGSTDGTSEAIAEQFPDTTIIRGDGSLHYAAGTNRGISAAMEWKAEYIVAMNDDSVVHPEFLQHLLRAAARLEHSVIGALLLLLDAPDQVMQVAPRWQTLRGGWQVPEDLTVSSVGKEPFEVETIVGNCVLYPRKAIEECGLMDEANFPCGWGDIQYIARMKRAGWKLFVEPRALVWCERNTYPEPLHTRSFSSVLKALFSDVRHPLNLQRQFRARWHSAPSKIEALAAFTIFLGSLVGKSVGLGVAAPRARGAEISQNVDSEQIGAAH